MQPFDLVKYRYGTVQRYTAFCLTPRLAEPEVVSRGDRSWLVFNEGLSSNRAKHFQRSQTAWQYLEANGQLKFEFDWSLLPGTVDFPGVNDGGEKQRRPAYQIRP